MADGKKRQVHVGAASVQVQRAAFVRGNVARLVAFDLILGIVLARTVGVALVSEIARVDGINHALAERIYAALHGLGENAAS